MKQPQAPEIDLPETAKTRRKPSAELSAMCDCERRLEALEPAAQKRCLKWLYDRFGPMTETHVMVFEPRKAEPRSATPAEPATPAPGG